MVFKEKCHPAMFSYRSYPENLKLKRVMALAFEYNNKNKTGVLCC